MLVDCTEKVCVLPAQTVCGVTLTRTDGVTAALCANEAVEPQALVTIILPLQAPEGIVMFIDEGDCPVTIAFIPATVTVFPEGEKLEPEITTGVPGKALEGTTDEIDGTTFKVYGTWLDELPQELET